MQSEHSVRPFPSVDAHYDFPALEERILKFWEDRQIFEQSLKKPASKGSYVFYEGPPTANNLPHIGHILTRCIKDLFPRYRTMRGHRVMRKAGWDTHGLPVEIAIEKKLGFQGKEAIEQYGVAEFNRQCYDNVRTYEREWAKTSKRIAFWLDYENAYFTFTNPYIESVWWLLAKMYDEGLLFQGHKVLPYCPLCGTTLSSHEVAQNYQDVKDPSVYVKFRVTPGQTIKDVEGNPITSDGNLYLLSWTTTPWTLPSNVALAVHPDYFYRVVESKARPGERLIIAEGLELPVDEPLTGADGRSTAFDLRSAETLGRLSGRDLDGLTYESLFDFAKDAKEKGWYVVTAEYVTLTDGTGIVHQAPAYGQEDYLVGQKRGLPFVMMVDAKGRFVKEAGAFAGMWFKDADPEIIADLKKRNLLLKSQKIEHSYPFCWRHDTPLYYFATGSWFVRTTAFKEKLIALNQTVGWFPPHIRDGRFGDWLENMVDWAISRKRYWGTPLPVWKCSDCSKLHVVNSYQALFTAAGREMPEGIYDPAVFNPHRPHIDDFTWPCQACGTGTMRRVTEVIDCWFDAGAMPFAQHHYPFENRELIDQGEQFPADFISEAVDQTRGWFYTLLAISALIKGSVAYKNCIVLGHILDEKGQKMSKRLGNVVDPWQSIQSVGADTIRWYFYSNVPVGQPTRYSDRMVRESARSFLLPLYNAYSFFTIYANIDGWRPGKAPVSFKQRDALDRWILTRLAKLNQTVVEALEHYHYQEAAQALEAFVDSLNNWYIRRSRRRFWTDEASLGKESAYQTLYQVLTTLTKMVAPFTPFLAEELYQGLERPYASEAPESVHLTDYPEPRLDQMDLEVDQAMQQVLRLVKLGHAARNLSQVKVRQPLSRLIAVTLSDSIKAQVMPFMDTVLEELNIHRLEWAQGREAYVAYQVKPNFRKLGPRMGKRMQALREAVLNADPASLMLQLSTSGRATILLEGQEESLSSEELEVTMTQKEGTITASDEDLLVVLDTTLTQELKQEGLAREFISKIQSLRKERSLEYTDRIDLQVSCSPALEAALRASLTVLEAETLATSIVLGPLPDNAPDIVEDTLEGERLQLTLRVHSKA